MGLYYINRLIVRGPHDPEVEPHAGAMPPRRSPFSAAEADGRIVPAEAERKVPALS
jgi:hypothetical protein